MSSNFMQCFFKRVEWNWIKNTIFVVRRDDGNEIHNTFVF